MPGLIDAHIHTPPKLAIGNQRLFSLLYLQYGVTTVRDLGQLDDSLPKLMRNIDTGKFPGPRMYRCGPVLDGTPASFQGALSIQTATEATQTVATLAAEGVSCIKTYDRLPAEAFIAASKEAKKRALPLMGHTPHSVKLTDIDNFEIAHFTGVPYLEDAPPEGRAYLSQDLIDMTDEDVADVIALMKQNNLSILPTNANTLALLRRACAIYRHSGSAHGPELFRTRRPKQRSRRSLWHHLLVWRSCNAHEMLVLMCWLAPM